MCCTHVTTKTSLTQYTGTIRYRINQFSSLLYEVPNLNNIGTYNTNTKCISNIILLYKFAVIFPVYLKDSGQKYKYTYTDIHHRYSDTNVYKMIKEKIKIKINCINVLLRESDNIMVDYRCAHIHCYHTFLYFCEKSVIFFFFIFPDQQRPRATCYSYVCT